MKKLFALMLAVLMAIGMFAGCTTTESNDDGYTIEKGKLIMSTNAEFPPYEMKDDSGKFIGIDVEIAKAIAEKLEEEIKKTMN